MLTYLFERMRTISYASNADTLLIRDKRANCEPLHRHNYNEMIYIYEGEAVHSINGVSYNLVRAVWRFLPRTMLTASYRSDRFQRSTFASQTA